MKEISETSREIKSIFFKIVRTNSISYVVYFQKSRIDPYCKSVAVTKIMHMIIHVEIEFNDFALGDVDVTLLKIFIKHKSNVISRAIRPGITSCGITNPIFKWVIFYRISTT